MANAVKLGIIGFGCVGQGLYEVLKQTEGVQAEIVRICVKNREKERPLPAHYFQYDPWELILDPEVDVVVELTNDPVSAYEWVRGALRAGKAVVTANKKMVAEHFEELHQLQEDTGAPLLYEGAVCAAIPILRNLEEYYDNDLLSAVSGIFNGSTNYILTRMLAEGQSYADALQEAQQLGYAETNPLLDVGGFDPKFKLAIVLAHAFGLFVRPAELPNIGIDRLSSFDAAYAREKGWKLKLLAFCRRNRDQIVAGVLPSFVEPDNRLFGVDGVYNAVVVESAFAETQCFTGKGAGAYPTGSAVLSDISALTYRYRYEYKKWQQRQKRHSHLEISNHALVHVYLRYPTQAPPAFSSFRQIEEAYANTEEAYVTGWAVLDELLAAVESRPDCSAILLPDAFVRAQSPVPVVQQVGAPVPA